PSDLQGTEIFTNSRGYLLLEERGWRTPEDTCSRLLSYVSPGSDKVPWRERSGSWAVVTRRAVADQGSRAPALPTQCAPSRWLIGASPAPPSPRHHVLLAHPVTVSGPEAYDPCPCTCPCPARGSCTAAPLGKRSSASEPTEVSAAGDSGEGPRHLPEAAAPDSAAGKGGPGEPEAGAGGEGERPGSGDQPETRSVCSSRSSSSGGGGDQRAGHQHQHHQPICKICFQGAEQGELLNPCRCDGSVRYTHQLCLLKWISERGSWTCELCCYRYHVIAIKMKQPCQWQSISITLVEKVQMIAVILGSLFLIASVTWLLWSAFSPYAVWQRKDLLFQICYGMYGFMDLVCIGLIVHEGAAVYRVFKRWRAVNLHWDVLNYDKATDIEESSRGESSTSRTLWLPLSALRNRNLVHPTQLTSPRFQCRPPCIPGNVIAMNGETIALLKTYIYELFKIYAFYMKI
uniref:RING-type E3 ubiquitin transferase n=1 Tax=Oryctolagus cuniculus TaxID=9986 RepID=G1SLR0_RABIT